MEKRLLIRKKYIERLSNVKGVLIPYKDNNEFVSNYIMPIVLENSTVIMRENVREKLKQCGIQTSIHYPAIHKFSMYQSYNAFLPKTDYVTNNEITLPMYSSLTNDQIDFIVDQIDIAVNQ